MQTPPLHHQIILHRSSVDDPMPADGQPIPERKATVESMVARVFPMILSSLHGQQSIPLTFMVNSSLMVEVCTHTPDCL